MNPFMKPLYQEFKGHLYRLFNATIDNVRDVHLDATGKVLDDEFETLFNKYGPRRLRQEMNWQVTMLAVIQRERETGEKISLDDIGAFYWTLGLRHEELELHEMEDA